MRFDEKLAKLKAILSEESTFPDAAEDVVEQLNALAGGRLTDEMLAYFRMLGMSRNERVFLDNIQFLGAEWMIKENTDAVPACTVLPYGFFCVASYINGDAICVDLEDVYHPVYHIPVELVNDGDTITMWVDEKLQSFPLNRENILLASYRYASDFGGYIEHLCEGIGRDPVSVTYIQKKVKEELELRQLPGGIRFEIEDGVLKKCKVSKLVNTVRVPEGVTAIGEGAFSALRVREIYISDSVTGIGSRAFEYCTALHSVRLPGNITEFPERMFFMCMSLKNFTIPTGVTTFGDECFYECYALDEICIPEGIREISKNCYEHCIGLTEIVIPRSVESINSSAFAHCEELRSVFIPDTVTCVERSAFHNSDRITKFRWEGRVDAVELKINNNYVMSMALWALNNRRLDDSVDEGVKYPMIIGMYRENGNSEALAYITKKYKKMATYFIENDCAENLVYLASHSEFSAKNRLKELIKLAEQYNNRRICQMLTEMK